MVQEVDYLKLPNNQILSHLQYAFRDRKNRKRAFRSLWIARINAGVKRAWYLHIHVLINSMSEKNIILDRKILSDIAVTDQYYI